MASSYSTSPFFFPTTMVPSPPCGCDARVYAQCSFSPAATYPPPPLPDGYYTSPFPCFYGGPPAFPYPPPTSAYTPVPGFSPNWPPPSLDPTPSSMPPTFSSFPAPTFGAPTTTPALPESTAPPAMDSTPLPAYHTSSSPKEVGKYTAGVPRQAADRTPRRRRSLTHADGARPHADGLEPERAVPLHPDHQDGHGLFQVVQEGQHGDQAPATYERQVTDYTSAPRLSSLDGLLDDVFDRIPEVTPSAPSRFSNTSVVVSSSELCLSSHIGESLAATAPTCDPVSATSASTMPSATAYTATQVVAEKQIPQSYGFHNLNIQSVIRADGTEHSYFTLPVNYPLERDVPKPVFVASDDKSDSCSTELVQVFTEEKQHESHQLVECFGKAQEIEQTTACLNCTSDVFGYTLELQQQDDERASNCLVWKASVSFITRSSQLSIEHTMRELRLLWDPGSLKSIMDAPALVKISSLEGLAHAVIFSPSILLPMSVYAATSIPNILIRLPLYILWDTGDTKYHAMFTTAAGATKFQGVDICKPTMVQKLDVHFRARSESILESAIMSSCAFGLGRTEVNAHQLRDPPLKVLVTPERRKEWDPGEHTFRSSTQNGDISIYDQVKCLNPLSLTTPWDPGVLVILHSCTATHPIVTHPGAFAHVPQSIFASTECYYVFCLGGTEAKTTTVLVLVIPCSKGKSVSMHSLCSCQMVTIAGQTITFQSCATKSVQVTKNKHPREFLMAEMLLIVSEFRDGQLTYMPQCPTINSSEFERHMVTVLSCWLSSLENRAKLQWDPGIAISSCMDSWLEMRTTNTLTWLQRPLLKDALQCQLPMSNTSCVWDHGIQPISFLHRRLHLHNIQLVRCSAIHINNCTSTTYVCIASSEYPYIVDFLTDQLGFIHQQGIQENYNTKCLLLSSQDGVKIREMGIMFITFLPP